MFGRRSYAAILDIAASLSVNYDNSRFCDGLHSDGLATVHGFGSGADSWTLQSFKIAFLPRFLAPGYFAPGSFQRGSAAAFAGLPDCGSDDIRAGHR